MLDSYSINELSTFRSSERMIHLTDMELFIETYRNVIPPFDLIFLAFADSRDISIDLIYTEIEFLYYKYIINELFL